MARKPNYNFEKAQREKAKAAKKAERLQAKADKAAAKKDGGIEGADEGDAPIANDPPAAEHQQ